MFIARERRDYVVSVVDDTPIFVCVRLTFDVRKYRVVIRTNIPSALLLLFILETNLRAAPRRFELY